jgi:hypothetical protein
MSSNPFSLEDLVELFPWSTRVNELVPSIEVDLNVTMFDYQSFYIQNTHDIEKLLSDSEYNKQIETLHSLIFYCKGALLYMSSNSMIELRPDASLQRRIYADYMNGNNYKLQEYKSDVFTVIVHAYNQYKSLELAGAFDLTFSIHVRSSIVKVIQTVELLRYLQEKLKEIEPPVLVNGNRSVSKLKWTGTPAQFGFIIDLLIQKGYLEKPAKSYAKDADIYLEHFDIECAKSSLIKELSESTNSIVPKNRKSFHIPRIDQLG